MPKLCVSACIKDEARILSGWLENHAELSDELLIVDTGSTDNSVEIAEAWGAHIRHQDIEQGFDVVRTYCITEAAAIGCEWVIILDADERIYRFVPDFELREEETEIDMSTLWPAGGAAPTHRKYEAIPTGPWRDQHAMIRQLIEDPFCVAYNTRRRHWFDWSMKFPCQPAIACGDTPGIDDWQRRFCRTDKGLKFIRKVHEWLRRPDGGEPEPTLNVGMEGPWFDHFHVPAKAIYPDRADEVNELIRRLVAADDEHRSSY